MASGACATPMSCENSQGQVFAGHQTNCRSSPVDNSKRTMDDQKMSMNHP